MTLLREQLLAGRTVVLSGSVADDVRSLLDVLGATVHDPGTAFGGDALGGEDEAAAAWAREHAPLDALVHDCAASFAGGGADGLSAALETAWRAVAAVANGALIAAEGAGKIVLIAPRPDAGPHADAARAAIENLARTLSVEWARYAITVTAILPGAQTTGDELATFVSYLLSHAGDYFTGCRFELGAVTAS